VVAGVVVRFLKKGNRILKLAATWKARGLLHEIVLCGLKLVHHDAFGERRATVAASRVQMTATIIIRCRAGVMAAMLRGEDMLKAVFSRLGEFKFGAKLEVF
jgi:hypothetical protein